MLFRLFLEELVSWIEQSPKSNVARYWKEVLHLLPPPLNDAFKPRNWRHIYNMQQVTSALSRIQVVGYDEKLVHKILMFLDFHYLSVFDTEK